MVEKDGEKYLRFFLSVCRGRLGWMKLIQHMSDQLVEANPMHVGRRGGCKLMQELKFSWTEREKEIFWKKNSSKW